MNKPLLGLFAVLGNWPNWEDYFDLSRRGLKVSFGALVASLIPLWLMVYGLEIERARLSTEELSLPNVLPFILVASLWLFSFPALAYLIGTIFERMDRVRPWIITRNWTLFALASVAGLMFGLVGLGVLPFVVATGIGFAAFLGLIAADIRLAQKVAEMNWNFAALTGCGIVAVGLTFVVLAITA